MKAPDTPIHRLLLAAIRTPWTSPQWLASQAELTLEEADEICTEAIGQGLAQHCWHSGAHTSVRLVAPTERGVEATARAMESPVAELLSMCHFTSARFWAMRCAQPIVQDVTTIIASTAQSIKSGEMQAHGFTHIEHQVFVQRRHHMQDVFVHGLIELYTEQHLKCFYLLIDHAHSDVWQWAGLLRCLRNAAKATDSVASSLPALLIISRGSFRAMAMLALAKMCGLSTPIAATGRLSDVRKHGLLWKGESNGWASVMGGEILSGVHPLQLASDIPRLMAKHQQATQPKRRALNGPLDMSPPTTAQRIDDLDTLTPSQQQLLVFLSRNPVVPLSVISIWLGATDLHENLTALEAQGFAERVPTKLDESIWAATFAAMQLLAARQMQPEGWLRRYRFFRADHERRLLHTLAGYRFLAALKEQCERRSRSMRKLDTRPGTLNTGVIPYYWVAAFESEWMASDWYASAGHLHYWRPDGYGALRAGASTTHFWMEIDGTANAPSRKDPQIWAGKLGRLCDYIQSRRWQLRYPALPRLLIVTTDLRNRLLIFDALTEAVRARAMAVPQVWVASSVAVQQRGTLAKIWFNASIGSDVMDYAFENISPIAVGVRSPLDLRQPVNQRRPL